MKRFSNPKIRNIFIIINGIAFLIITSLIIYIVNNSMKQQAFMEAEAKARILIDRNMATHTYFSHIMKPRLFEWTAPFRKPEYFDPSWMSSTYAIREIDKYFDSLNPSGYYVKDAAINARSPENEADDYERLILDKMKKDSKLEHYSEIRSLNGKPYLAVLRKGELMEESCLRCHSIPGNAPKNLLQYYDPERSFHRKVGDLASVISLRIPLSAAYEETYRAVWQISILLAAVLAFLFGIHFFLYKRYLTSPIGTIRDKAIEIAGCEEQHLGEKIPEPFGRELKELAGAFNEMSVRLRIGRDNLEDRVEERTRELKTSNEQLANEIDQRLGMEDALRESNVRLEQNLKGMIDVISGTIELKGPYAAGHHQRVSKTASAIPAEMDLNDFQRQGIELAAAVYDIGLTGIPSEFLQDTERLEGTRLILYQGYPATGYNMLKQIDFPWPIADIILQHRERFDGAGFPKGIKGKEILIEASVLSVAEAIEDLTTQRVYRSALPLEKVLEVIVNHSGSKYDPDVVAASLRLFNEKGYKLQ